MPTPNRLVIGRGRKCAKQQRADRPAGRAEERAVVTDRPCRAEERRISRPTIQLLGKPAIRAVAAASVREESTVGIVRNSVNKPANQPAEHSL